ncbi:hypothetical protein RJT34_20164 [Clitoria ternatea]|uniref:Uncharacterized protein n=1 Tax=Clitoria ternatea TaxID=43366 RepID=A0AAN9P5G8_CLITE
MILKRSWNSCKSNFSSKRKQELRYLDDSNESQPIGYDGDGLEGKDETKIGVGAAVLPAAEGGGEELDGDAVRLGDDGGESVVGEERVGRTADANKVVVAGLIGEGSPLKGFIYGVRS